MKVGALRLFKRKHCNGIPCSTILLAGWHWKWSITWRWNLQWSPLAGRLGSYFMRTHKGRGFNFCAGLNVPVLGSISLETQPNMRA